MTDVTLFMFSLILYLKIKEFIIFLIRVHKIKQ